MRNTDVRAARSRITVSVGESVRIGRELQEMTQSELARLTGSVARSQCSIERPGPNSCGRDSGARHSSIASRSIR